MAATKHDVVASRLFASVMAPLVLGGIMQPGRAIGARAALELGQQGHGAVRADVETRVRAARVRRARALVPIDELGPATDAEWALAAALHDILQAANPNLVRPLRRGAAKRILELAETTIDRVGPPATLHEALSRHTWFARVLDIGRTDTHVSWWSGSHSFRGVEPSRRLQAWPTLRRVSIASALHPLVELTPLAVDRERLVGAVAKLLARTPLTELATCTRGAPRFVWGDATLALVATAQGKTLALRALARLPTADVDAALGRATRDALAQSGGSANIAIALLADRAIAQVQGYLPAPLGPPAAPDASFARCLGAAAATHELESPDSPWPEATRRRWLDVLGPPAREGRSLLASLSEQSKAASI